jgi:hypothetical protein
MHIKRVALSIVNRSPTTIETRLRDMNKLYFYVSRESSSVLSSSSSLQAIIRSVEDDVLHSSIYECIISYQSSVSNYYRFALLEYGKNQRIMSSKRNGKHSKEKT